MTDGSATTGLRYSTPAGRWTDALPLGNGRLGAMCFGGVDVDRIQLNDGTCWSGSPASGRRPGSAAGPDVIQLARAALAGDDVRGAEDILHRVQGGHSQSFQPLADLWIRQEPGDGRRPEHYRRGLDLRAAVAHHEYVTGGQRIAQQAWISAPAQALFVRRQATRGSLPPTELLLDSGHPTARTRAWTMTAETRVGRVEAVVRMPSEVFPPHESTPEPVRYDAAPGAAVTAVVGVRLLAGPGLRESAGGPVVGPGPQESVGEPATGPTVRTSDGGLVVNGAGDLLIVVSSVTDYRDPFTDPHGDVDLLRRELDARLDALVDLLSRPDGYRRLRAEHQADHARLFARVELSLGAEEAATEAAAKDTDARVREHADGASDPALTALLFQYGRYLLIASSRPGGLPANLQGIWNDKRRPPWSSNYTTNINLEMNYWPAEVANLAECHTPLLRWLTHASRRGARVARELYGSSGWVLHHNSDAWCFALPAGEGNADPVWSFWPLGAAWLSRHVFDHYDYTRDPAFLREQGWPLVKSAGEFCLDWLVELPDGTLGTTPSTSPENHYLAADGEPAAVTVSTTADLILIGDLLRRGLEMLAALPEPDPTDTAWARRARAALHRLPTARVGPDGRLAEWSRDVIDAEPEHRHTSHLIDVYPAHGIDPDTAPDLARAARRTLDARGPKSTGWALAWRLALRARLRDTDGALEMLRMFLAPMADDASEEPSMSAPAGVYRNLFCAHPPFQIDGNFGLTAGVAEMLIQSHATEGDTTVVHLLPALPQRWAEGSFTGLCARGGVTVDACWSRGAVQQVILRAGNDRTVVLRIADRSVRLAVLAGVPQRWDTGALPWRQLP